MQTGGESWAYCVPSMSLGFPGPSTGGWRVYVNGWKEGGRERGGGHPENWGGGELGGVGGKGPLMSNPFSGPRAGLFGPARVVRSGPR